MNKHKFHVLSIALLLGAVFLGQVGLAQGIRFYEQESWQQIRTLAAGQKKLIFIDVYTDWCGPCKLMDQEVFALSEVGDFFNDTFVNYKLDAEKGEGIALSKQFGVRSYPNFLFVDPVTGEVVHRSSGRQQLDVFMATGSAALHPDRRSEYLKSRYEQGDRSEGLLRHYAAYLASCYQRKELGELVTQYFDAHPAGLSEPLGWEFFSLYEEGTKTPRFAQLLEQLPALKVRYGSQAVDRKLNESIYQDIQRVLTIGIYNPHLFDANAYNQLSALFEGMDFEGKAVTDAKIRIWDLLRNKQYTAAAALVDRFPEIAGMDQREILGFYQALYLPSRSINDVHWMKHVLRYVRYIAMNDLDKRSQALIHHNYALFLEQYLILCQEQQMVPDVSFLDTPRIGETRYTLRPPDLKEKPKPVR